MASSGQLEKWIVRGADGGTNATARAATQEYVRTVWIIRGRGFASDRLDVGHLSCAGKFERHCLDRLRDRTSRWRLDLSAAFLLVSRSRVAANHSRSRLLCLSR